VRLWLFPVIEIKAIQISFRRKSLYLSIDYKKIGDISSDGIAGTGRLAHP